MSFDELWPTSARVRYDRRALADLDLPASTVDTLCEVGLPVPIAPYKYVWSFGFPPCPTTPTRMFHGDDSSVVLGGDSVSVVAVRERTGEVFVVPTSSKRPPMYANASLLAFLDVFAVYAEGYARTCEILRSRAHPKAKNSALVEIRKQGRVRMKECDRSALRRRENFWPQFMTI